MSRSTLDITARVKREDLLDLAILQLAKGGPRETWKLDVVDGPAWREDRDAWAKRVAEDALALASARERVLLATQAVDADFGQDGDAAPPPRAEAMTVERPRPEWLDAPFTQPFGTFVLMTEGAEDLRLYALSLEARLARTFRAPVDEVGSILALCPEAEVRDLPTDAAKVRALIASMIGYRQDRDSLAAKLAECSRALAESKAQEGYAQQARAAAERERDEALAQLTNEESVTRSQLQSIDQLTKQIDALRLGRTATPAAQTVNVDMVARELASDFGDYVDIVEILRKHLRPCPPTVWTVDEKRLLDDLVTLALSVGDVGGMSTSEFRTKAAALLRKHARPADAEGLAGAIAGGQVALSSLREPLDMSACNSIAGIALSHLGLALAQEPRDVLAGVDREKVIDAVHASDLGRFHAAFRGDSTRRVDAALASIREQLEARETRKEGA